MCTTEGIKVYEFANETAEKLKLGEEELMYIETEYVEKSVEIQSDFSVRHDNLKPEEYRLRFHIKEKLDKLRAAKGEILIATYSGERPKGSDIENTLFYNIGTGEFGKIFTDFPKQVAFWEHPDDSTHKYKYRYKVEKASEDAHKTKDFPESFTDDIKEKLRAERMVEWDNIPIDTKHGKFDKPDRYFAAIRKNFSKMQFSKQRQKSNDESFNFGIIIELTVPSKNHTSQPASDMTKHLLDGVICAFHGEKDGTDKRVREKFKNNGLNDEMIDEFFNSESKMNLFGNHVYLTRSNRWNPEDDRLKFGWIIVKCEGKEYKMSGEIYNWD